MHALARLKEVLPHVPKTTIHGPWSRAIGYHLLKGPPQGAAPGSPPQPLWPGGPASHGARFTPKGNFADAFLGGSFASLYLAEDHVTALHEVVSVFSPPHGALVTIKTNPLVVVTVEGVLSNIVDLTLPLVQEQLGTTLSELTGEWAYTQSVSGIAPTQMLGQAAFECGILGLKYRSSKNIPGGSALVVFADHLKANHPSFLEVVDEYRNISQRLP